MSIRVSSNQMMYNYKKQLNDANYRQDKLLEQGDGSKLHRPSDDSVAYTKYLRYDTSYQENTQYTKNVKNGLSWMKASDAALVSMTDIQTTFKEKTVAAANDTNSDPDFKAIGKEMMAEIQQLVSLGNTMQGDRYLFSGQSDTTRPFDLSTKEVERGLTKTLSDKAAAYFSGANGADDSGSVTQMLTLTGTGTDADGNTVSQTFYLNTMDGRVYSKAFVDADDPGKLSYKDIVAQNTDAVEDGTHALTQLGGWYSADRKNNPPTETVSKYFKNTGEIIDSTASPGSVTQDGVTYTLSFATVSQQIATYQGDPKYISMTKKNGTTEPTSDTVNTTGQDIWGTDIFDNANSGNAASGTAMLNEMLTVYTKVNDNDTHWLGDDGQTISDAAHETTNNETTRLGARQQLYTNVNTMLDNQGVLIQSDLTDVGSADVAELAMKLMEAQTVYNLSLSMGARVLPTSLADYLS